jgi:hypothetical protein
MTISNLKRSWMHAGPRRVLFVGSWENCVVTNLWRILAELYWKCKLEKFRSKSSIPAHIGLHNLVAWMARSSFSWEITFEGGSSQVGCL